jgi:hypothetical protein
MKYPSWETIKHSLWRALESGVSGALFSFTMIPINLNEPKKYLIALVIGLGTGFLTGLVKFVKGYYKYDA